MEFNISIEMKIEGSMTTLAKLYEKPSTSNKVFFMKHLFNMKMSDGGSVVDHLYEILHGYRSIFVGVNFDDEVMALFFCVLIARKLEWHGYSY